MKSFSYTAFLFLFVAAGLHVLPEPVHAEDDDAYRLQESVRPRRVRSRRYRRASGNDGYYESSRRRRRVRRRRPRSSRQLASYDDSRYRSRQNYYETDQYQSDDALEWLARVGLVGGLSSSSTVAAEGFNNIYVGVRGDLQYSYFGAELDFFYGIASKAQSESAVFLGDSFTEDSSLSNVGGDLSLKLQMPIRMGRDAKLVPKIGAGYSLLQQSVTVVSAGSNTTTTNVSTPHVLAGFDLYATAKLLFSADFALGLFGSASTTLSDTSGSQASAGPTSYTRVRAGAYYEIASRLMLGAQYTRREFRVDGTEFGDSQNQFLGVLMYSF
ncbi:MAG: hypothetical protein R3B54_10445 [Bdellovibrionota bacterium]